MAPGTDVRFVVLALACAGATFVLTGGVRRYALARSVLDIPNERSSHTDAVPRGGGLAIATAVLGAAAGGWLLGEVSGRLATAVCVGGALVAGVGWIDDHVGLRASVRAGTHAVAALIAVAALGGLPVLRVGDEAVRLGALGAIVAVVGIVWLTNLYNFMDGIDGLAGGQALTAGLAAAGLLLAADDRSTAWMAIAVAAASAGFLVWNWAPARIFMGDVGSGLLGFVFAVLGVASENRGSLPALMWALLLGVFVFDATVTLVRRVARGERWYDAHRSHAYQRAVRSGLRHASVTGAVLAINLLLAGLAVIASSSGRLLGVAAVSAAILLAGVYFWVERRFPMARA